MNDSFYNSLCFDDTLFIGVPDKNTVINSVTTEKRYYGLIDRDYLTDQERDNAIKNKETSLYILEMYSFESYMYHPDNIEELGLPNWNRQEYILNITQKKIDKMGHIGGSILGRNSSLLFKNKSKEEKLGRETILSELNSNNFEIFYKHFDIKKYGKPDLNLTEKELTSTQWFKTNIQKII